MSKRQIFQIQSNTKSATKGKVLISEPMAHDFYFQRSVVLLVEHNDKEGSFGIIMNKELDLTLSQASDDFKGCNFPLFLGGPVATRQIFFVHTLGKLIPDSTPICDGLYWGGNVDCVIEMLKANRINPSEIRFFLGYSGWDSFQLSDELCRDSWIVVNPDPIALIHSHPNEMWALFVKRAGSRYNMWLRYPANPHFN